MRLGLHSLTAVLQRVATPARACLMVGYAGTAGVKIRGLRADKDGLAPSTGMGPAGAARSLDRDLPLSLDLERSGGEVCTVASASCTTFSEPL